MKNIYLECAAAIGMGRTYSIDLKKRNLKVDGKFIIRRGKHEGNLGYINPETVNTPEFMSYLEGLYDRYAHSIPSERSDSQRRNYFKALPLSQLSEEDMMFGPPRDWAKFQLEFTILCGIIKGLKWNEDWGNWFWQSANYKDFIILREWIDGE